ncbi:cyclase family protein [Pseudarthrobacter sp. LMD1-1-1.1]|uniref:cyclase family protein n=1 Tax=Pseudarthrobacter sp. LMD1-1-1.1 TaxID=3135242 RepID=UPI003412B6CC
MSQLTDLLASLAAGTVTLVDLTNKLTTSTPSLVLPEPFQSPLPFALEEIAAYDDRGPVWKANDIHIGEHTGTHLDVPIHWVTGRDGDDVSELPLNRLIGPAVVLDFTAQAAADPDFLIDISDIKAWEEQYGTLPENGWALFRTGWDAYSQDQERFTNVDETGSHTPGFTADCARWLAEETTISGVGVETMGLDAGQAGTLEPEMPMHYYLLGNNKYGVTSLQNLSKLPTKGAVVVVAPLPIVGGTGSPARVLAFVEPS